VTPEAFGRSILEERRIAVCVGCGGVGKTTIAAAIGVEAARRGRRALVMTIDPARRLADALGVGELGNEPRAVDPAVLARLGVPEGGALSAMMLDMKRTFDDLVTRFAENDEARNRILENPIYQHASDALAGSVEYSAMEKVYELCQRDDYDLVVVDTPPAQHALDFLEAPERLLEFLDSRLVQLWIHPAMAAGRFGFRLFQRGTRRALQLIERVSGIGFLEDISEFLLAFEGMSEGFRARATEVRELLLGPDSSFVLVTGVGTEAARHSLEFLDRLETFRVPLMGVIANRVHRWPGGGPVPDLTTATRVEPIQALEAALGADADPEEGFPAHEATRAAIAAAKGYAALVMREEQEMRALAARTRAAGRFWGTVPELPKDVHDLQGLGQVAQTLFGRNDVFGRDDEGDARGAVAGSTSGDAADE
jgi:anion-transporting  ArsA/GET3 family ATPase